MAKSASFFGLRRGSTKTLTFSVLDGQQITKDRVTEVKNPRTDMQMQQRCLMKTCALGYSAMKTIVDHSFEGITYGGKSMHAFASKNYKLVKAASKAFKPTFGFPAFADSSLRLGQFVVAQGSLNRPIISGIKVAFGDNAISVELPAAESIAALCNVIGINLGELITLTALVQDDNKDVYFVWLRFTMPESDGIVAPDAIKIESNLTSRTEVAENKLTVSLLPQAARVSAASAMLFDFIRSAKSDSGWLRSSAKLTNVIGEPQYERTFESAIATYPTGSSYILNDGNSGIETDAVVKYGVTIEVTNSAGRQPAESSYVVSGAGLYGPGEKATVTLAKAAGGTYANAVAKVNGVVVQQNPIGTIQFGVDKLSHVVWDIMVNDGGGDGDNMGE